MAYLYFKSAIKSWLKEQKKTQNWLALEIGVEDGTISKYLGSTIAPFDKQVKIAGACGYDYFSFLQLGKEIYEGKPPQDSSKKIVPIDPAVEFLNECIQEAGVGDYLNDKQKQALLKIIRDELKSAEEKAKKDIKKYLAVLKE